MQGASSNVVLGVARSFPIDLRRVVVGVDVFDFFVVEVEGRGEAEGRDFAELDRDRGVETG